MALIASDRRKPGKGEQVQPSISVVIPTWNRASTIRRAVESALHQSIPVLEILVCDDGSTDETESVVAAITAQDARVRWLPGERGGRPAIPRNRGLRHTKGEWVAFLDSDDEWLPDKLKAQLEAAWGASSLAACANAMRVAGDGRELGLLLDWHSVRLTLSDLLDVNRVVCSSCVIHRSLLAKIGGFPEEPEFTIGEDYVLWLRAACLTSFAYCPDPLVRYRDDLANSIRNGRTVPPAPVMLAATRAWLLERRSGLSVIRRLRPLAIIVLAEMWFAFKAFARGSKRALLK